MVAWCDRVGGRLGALFALCSFVQSFSKCVQKLSHVCVFIMGDEFWMMLFINLSVSMVIS